MGYAQRIDQLDIVQIENQVTQQILKAYLNSELKEIPIYNLLFIKADHSMSNKERPSA
jgi:hypothetical protein